jgi:ribose transport system substrate-binding protein
MRKILALLVLFSLAMPAASAAEIGVILTGKVLGIWQGMTNGMKRAAKDLHVVLIVRSPADGTALDRQKNIQLKLIDYMVRRGVAGIVLAPEPLDGVATPISVSVPTVLVDRSSTDYNAVSTVSTDNFTAGRTEQLSVSLPCCPRAPGSHRCGSHRISVLQPSVKMDS